MNRVRRSADRAPRALPFAGLRRSTGVFCVTALVGLSSARADCRLELELIGADLKGVVLSEQQKLQLAPLVDDALKRCRLGREEAALAFLEKARAVAGITRKVDDLDAPASTGHGAR